MWAKLKMWWDTPFAAFVAVIAGIHLPSDSLKDVTGELITFFGIQSAVILPSMLFTAGLLGPEGLSVEQAQRYHKALGKQMTFWTVLLVLDFMAVLLLISGKAMGWQLFIHIPRFNFEFDASGLLLGAVTFAGVLALLRAIPFVRGIRSLHELRGELLQLAIKARNSQVLAHQEAVAEQAPFVAPVDFGKIRTK